AFLQVMGLEQLCWIAAAGLLLWVTSFGLLGIGIYRMHSEVSFEVYPDHLQVVGVHDAFTLPLDSEISFLFYPVVLGGMVTVLRKGEAVATVQRLGDPEPLKKILNAMNLSWRSESWPKFVLVAGLLVMACGFHFRDDVVLCMGLLGLMSCRFMKVRRERKSGVRFRLAVGCMGAAVCSFYFLNAPFQTMMEVRELFHDGKVAQGITELENLVKNDSNPASMNTLAWTLITAPDAQLRDLPRALELSRESVELLSKSGNPKLLRAAQDTLACAYFANQKPDEARDLADRLKSGKRIAQFAEGQPCEEKTLYVHQKATYEPGQLKAPARTISSEF
ncbi:MAG: hypothetical protein H7222_15025, partial [Methylotenera sp.]|nr:hypothetical protein [Oligoflexia bacterium]